jgi:hypothetical protein
MTRQNWFRYTGGVVLLAMLGWAPADAAPAARAGRAQAGGDVTYSLRPDTDGSFVLAASSSEVTMRKAVYEDGHSVTVIERGNDRVTISATGAGLLVSRNGRSATIGTDARGDEPWVRVRALLAGSPAVRAFRTLSNALENVEADDPEQIGVRVSGALVAQLDGDEAAVGRLSRALRARHGGPLRQVRATATDCWAIYQAGVMKAAADLEACLNPISMWNPMRNVCAFVWTLQVEGLWFAYLSCCSVPLH